MKPLNDQQKLIFAELQRIAGKSKVVNSVQLKAHDFAEFVIAVQGSRSTYPQSILSRALQGLRDKGYIKMEKGIYTILEPGVEESPVESGR